MKTSSFFISDTPWCCANDGTAVNYQQLFMANSCLWQTAVYGKQNPFCN
jgi:hypothetical protein